MNQARPQDYQHKTNQDYDTTNRDIHRNQYVLAIDLDTEDNSTDIDDPGHDRLPIYVAIVSWTASRTLHTQHGHGKGSNKVAVGSDSRISGPKLKKAFKYLWTMK